MTEQVTAADRFAARIAAERDRTLARIAGLRRDFDAIVTAAAESPPDDEHDPEGATIGFERAQISALLDAAQRHLADLDEAARRLAEDRYGCCERCGDQIADERLLARPATRTCVACA